MKVEGVSQKIAEKVWEDYVKDEFGAKPKSVKGAKELLAEGAESKNISKQEFNLYSSMTVSGNDIIITAWFDLGASFLNKDVNSASHETAKVKLIEYNYAVKRYLAQEEVEKEEDKLKDAEKALAKVVDDGEDLKEDIRDYEDKAAKAKRELEKNKTDQDVAQKALEAQTKALEEAKIRLEKIGK